MVTHLSIVFAMALMLLVGILGYATFTGYTQGEWGILGYATFTAYTRGEWGIVWYATFTGYTRGEWGIVWYIRDILKVSGKF